MGKYLTIVLKEMCKRVGADFNKIDFKRDNWYWDYSWKKGGAEKFTKWLADYLYNNPKALRELAFFPIRTRAFCLRLAESFENNYGWRTTEL